LICLACQSSLYEESTYLRPLQGLAVDFLRADPTRRYEQIAVSHQWMSQKGTKICSARELFVTKLALLAQPK
jgi:hypothetical protein